MIKGKIISSRELMFTETTVGRWRFHKNEQGEWLTESGEKAVTISMEEFLERTNKEEKTTTDIEDAQVRMLQLMPSSDEILEVCNGFWSDREKEGQINKLDHAFSDGFYSCLHWMMELFHMGFTPTAERSNDFEDLRMAAKVVVVRYEKNTLLPRHVDTLKRMLLKLQKPEDILREKTP